MPIDLVVCDTMIYGLLVSSKLLTFILRDANIDLAIYGDSAYIVKIGDHLKARHHYPDITDIEIRENKHISEQTYI